MTNNWAPSTIASMISIETTISVSRFAARHWSPIPMPRARRNRRTSRGTCGRYPGPEAGLDRGPKSVSGDEAQRVQAGDRDLEHRDAVRKTSGEIELLLHDRFISPTLEARDWP